MPSDLHREVVQSLTPGQSLSGMQHETLPINTCRSHFVIIIISMQHATLPQQTCRSHFCIASEKRRLTGHRAETSQGNHTDNTINMLRHESSEEIKIIKSKKKQFCESERHSQSQSYADTRIPQKKQSKSAVWRLEESQQLNAKVESQSQVSSPGRSLSQGSYTQTFLQDNERPNER